MNTDPDQGALENLSNPQVFLALLLRPESPPGRCSPSSLGLLLSSRIWPFLAQDLLITALASPLALRSPASVMYKSFLMTPGADSLSSPESGCSQTSPGDSESAHPCPVHAAPHSWGAIRSEGTCSSVQPPSGFWLCALEMHYLHKIRPHQDLYSMWWFCFPFSLTRLPPDQCSWWHHTLDFPVCITLSVDASVHLWWRKA